MIIMSWESVNASVEYVLEGNLGPRLDSAINLTFDLEKTILLAWFPISLYIKKSLISLKFWISKGLDGFNSY